MDRSSAPTHRLVSLLGFILLLVLHHDFWRGDRDALHFGWLPEELAYRLVWTLAATLWLVHLCRRVWVLPEGER